MDFQAELAAIFAAAGPVASTISAVAKEYDDVAVALKSSTLASKDLTDVQTLLKASAHLIVGLSQDVPELVAAAKADAGTVLNKAKHLLGEGLHALGGLGDKLEGTQQDKLPAAK